jgi:hypothetical protein
MLYFQTKNPYLGIFWRDLELKMLVYFVSICNILQPIGTLWPFGKIFPLFGMLYQEKSGNPGQSTETASQREQTV